MATATRFPEEQINFNFNEDFMWQIAEQTATSNGFTFTKLCEDSLKYAIQTIYFPAVKNDALVSPNKPAEATVNMVVLVNAMMDEARMQNVKELHEWSLANALKKLCPIWPFCSTKM